MSHGKSRSEGAEEEEHFGGWGGGACVEALRQEFSGFRKPKSQCVYWGKEVWWV